MKKKMEGKIFISIFVLVMVDVGCMILLVLMVFFIGM